MKAFEIIDVLKNYSTEIWANTVDTLKFGNPDKEAKKVAFCHTITPDVLSAASKWDADVIITHEPTLYDHFDNYNENIISARKKAMVEDSGITVYRFHDHAHLARPDLIHRAFLNETGIKGQYDGSRILKLETPMSARDMARIISREMSIRHPRLVGNIDAPVTNVALCLGACGDMAHDVVLNGEADMVICGEFCEWKSGEYFRDAAQMGLPYSLIAIGHAACEKGGMRLAAEMLAKDCPDLQTRYFDCGDLIIFDD